VRSKTRDPGLRSFDRFAVMQRPRRARGRSPDRADVGQRIETFGQPLRRSAFALQGGLLRLLPRFWAAVLCGPLCEWAFCDGPYFPVFCLLAAFISDLLVAPYAIKPTTVTARMLSIGFCVWYGVAFLNIANREY
jgi:hypothetical protein